MMYIVRTVNNISIEVEIRPVEDNDYKHISIKRYLFNWKKLKEKCQTYKLTLIDSEDILGLMACIDHLNEERVEIKLLAASKENIGKEKLHDRIAGCLIAFAGREAVRKFKNYPCISLIPKTELKQHYIDRYNMLDAGCQLYLEDIPLLKLIKEYLP